MVSYDQATGVTPTSAEPEGIGRLGPGPEFDLIRRFYSGWGRRNPGDVRVGPGDDAAVVTGDGIVLSVDLSVEEIHFRREWLTPEEIGGRAAAAALSDLAAMAARPIGILAALALVPADADAIATDVMRGVRSAVEGVGGVLLGGDLSRSPGPMILDIVAVGEASAPVLRWGAMAGDEIWVTGQLGASGLAVATLQRGERPPADAFERFRRPTPRIAEARWLAERGVPRAMLDLSDGLGGDVAHLARAAELAAILQADALPLHPALARARLSSVEALRYALTGGEDYELCFAARPGTMQAHQAAFNREFGIGLQLVGHFEQGEGVHVRSGDGSRVALSQAGYQHFGGPR
jgi:thiamine-monophosphate kinase